MPHDDKDDAATRHIASSIIVAACGRPTKGTLQRKDYMRLALFLSLICTASSWTLRRIVKTTCDQILPQWRCLLVLITFRRYEELGRSEQTTKRPFLFLHIGLRETSDRPHWPVLGKQYFDGYAFRLVKAHCARYNGHASIDQNLPRVDFRLR